MTTLRSKGYGNTVDATFLTAWKFKLVVISF